MKVIFILLGLLVGLSGCKKLLQVDPPGDQLLSVEVFSSDASAISAMNGLYASFVQNSKQFGTGALTLYPGLSADEILNSISNPATDLEFSSNSIDPANSSIHNTFWSPAYYLIYQANSIIEGAEASNSLSESTRKQLMAEAKFIRAFIHYYLVQLFGDVPLILTTDFRTNTSMPRVTINEIYTQLISDLKEVILNLSENYPTAGRVRPNKHTAAALLTRVYVQVEKYADAELLGNEILSSPLYILESDLNKVFLSSSKEAIWQLQPVGTVINTSEGNVFIPPVNTIPTYTLTTQLLNSFEADDHRKASWTKEVIVGGNAYTYPLKYKIRTGTPLVEFYMVFRLAEQYLLRAEALAMQNKLTEALKDLNLIRVRAGLAAISLPDQQELLDAIRRERRVELFLEWGHRWFDLKRWSLANDILQPIKSPNWQETDVLYPIPASQIISNPSLTQNDGY